jgi:hypothetical protein
MCPVNFYGFELFTCPNVEQVETLTLSDLFCQGTRLDLHRPFRRITGNDMAGYFLNRKIPVTRAHLGQCFLRPKPAAAATADVISTKQGALGARELFQQFPHR